MNPETIEVIAFDLFGTIFDMTPVPREELRAYGEHIAKPEWSKLTLPESWDRLRPFGDVRDSLEELRNRFLVVTLSNAPMALQTRLINRRQLAFDAIVPLEWAQVFKPKPAAYEHLCTVLNVEPSQVLMVSANKNFGDIENSRSIGMQSQLIRNDNCPQDLAELADILMHD